MSAVFDRDREILRLTAEGLEQSEIAERLAVSVNVVKNVRRDAKKLANVPAVRPAGALLRYDAACRAIAEARSIDEVRDWSDKAAAIREYARRARNRSLEIDAAEIRVRAERRRGELLAEMRATGRLTEGRPKKLSLADDSFAEAVTLDQLDTTRDESSRAQKLASIAPDAFERLTARVRARLERDAKLHAFDVLKENQAPHNASRVEDADSRDYSPTPPWATRALFHYVLPCLGYGETFWRGAPFTVWEPACGEGHIAAVLQEFFWPDCVTATDIHDYSTEGRSPPAFFGTRDFLESAPDFGREDWIITNPPFGDRVLPFMRTALDRAGTGVALFLQLRYLEGVERYDEVFRNRPPSLVAPFVERVPLHMGRYEPDGSTMTAFMWLVWVKGMAPRPPFWIPPSRKDLTRPDDRERFTAHPVLPFARSEEGESYDPETGEIIEEIGGRSPPSNEHGRDSRERPAPSPIPNPRSLPDPEIPAFLLRERAQGIPA